jgi:hypothetical protein
MPSSSPKGSDGESSKKSERLPFEPNQTRKKSPKKVPATPGELKKASPPTTKQSSGSTANAPSKATAIPEAVSRRMAKRMAFFSGVPTALGILTFVASYVIVSQHWFKLPNIAVVLVSMGFFGLGVLGLSYGVLSACWDEERLGSWHGWGEFTTNFGRIRESWRSRRQNSDASS